jgi:CBS-domain-containing membrane protein
VRANAFQELTAADVMSDVVLAIPQGMSVRGAARLMAEAGACAAPVTDARGRCVGLLLASDVLRWVADGEWAGPEIACFWTEWQMDAAAGGTTVGRRMTADPPAVTPDAPSPRDGSAPGGGERERRRTGAGGRV